MFFKYQCFGFVLLVLFSFLSWAEASDKLTPLLPPTTQPPKAETKGKQVGASVLGSKDPKKILQGMMSAEEKALFVKGLYNGQVFVIRDGRTLKRGDKVYLPPFFLLYSTEYEEYFRESPEALQTARAVYALDITARVFIGLAAAASASIAIMAFAAPTTLAPPSGFIWDSPAFWMGSASGLFLLLGISFIAAIPSGMMRAVSQHNHMMFKINYEKLTGQPFREQIDDPNLQPTIKPLAAPPSRTPFAPSERILLYSAH